MTEKRQLLGKDEAKKKGRGNQAKEVEGIRSKVRQWRQGRSNKAQQHSGRGLKKRGAEEGKRVQSEGSKEESERELSDRGEGAVIRKVVKRLR